MATNDTSTLIALWPWTQCRATAVFPEGWGRCYLKKGHEGYHSLDYGMYWIAWSQETWTEAPPGC